MKKYGMKIKQIMRINNGEKTIIIMMSKSKIHEIKFRDLGTILIILRTGGAKIKVRLIMAKKRLFCSIINLEVTKRLLKCVWSILLYECEI